MSVLISIQPKWCELIANGQKTVEIRKTKPKIKSPFKCYIYCTKARERFSHGGIGETLDDLYRMPSGEIKFGYSGELMCCEQPYSKDNFLNGKVIGEFICDCIEDYSLWEHDYPSLLRHINLYAGTNGDYKFLDSYLKGEKCCYGWHISDLVIYDEPKRLGDFKKTCDRENDCCVCRRWNFNNLDCESEIKRAPQSWCYAEI